MDASTARHILILTSGALCGNPRALKEARTLAAAGYRVTVINPSAGPVRDARDAAMASSAQYRQLVIPFDHRFATRCITWLARRALRVGIDTRRALGPSHGLLQAAARIPADLILVHNENAHWAGLRLLSEGRLVAADIEDWHSEDLWPSSRRYRPLRTLRRHEALLLRHAAHCTTTSESMADAMHAARGGRRPHVITNSFPLYQGPIHRDAGNGPVSLLWFSQTIGPGRGLERLMDAWGACSTDSALTLLGEGSPDYIASLIARLGSHKQHRLRIAPTLPPDDLPAFIAGHDVGLAIEEKVVPNQNLTISNKILQYCNAGLALLASNTIGQSEVMANGPDAGLLVEITDHDAFRRALEDLSARKDLLLSRRRAARALAERKYCWEREAPRLLDLVDKALHSRKRGKDAR